MARCWNFYCLLVVLLCCGVFNGVQSDVNHRTNVRCMKICKDESARVAQSHQLDCQRGCRYFNIEYLTSATGDSSDDVVDSSSPKVELKDVLEQAKTLCKDAYPSDGLRRDACDLGATRMHGIQSKAPILGPGDASFIVYMGAGEQNMVVVPDLMENSAQNDNGWLLLSSIFRPANDFNDDPSATYKLTETHVQTMPISGSFEKSNRFGDFRRSAHSPFCIPAWLWLIPVMLLVALVYIQYGSGNGLKSVVIFDEESSDDEPEIVVEGLKEDSGFNVTLKDKDTFVIAFEPILEQFVEAKLQDLPPKYEEFVNGGK